MERLINTLRELSAEKKYNDKYYYDSDHVASLLSIKHHNVYIDNYVKSKDKYLRDNGITYITVSGIRTLIEKSNIRFNL
jgi:hypothetical protein